MAKGKSTWRYNKLLTARRNYYNLGSFIDKIAGNPDENGKLTSGLFKDMSGAEVNFLKAAGSAVGQLGGKAISGGLESGAGNVISGLSSVASAIPGPWGAVASAGLGLIGGLTNRMFGSKLNEENIASVESNISDLANFQSNASDFDTLSDNWANAVTGMDFSNSFIGKDGWFSNKAGDKADDLREQVNSGVTFVDRTLANNADNLADAQVSSLLGNYTAFGGPLNTKGKRFGNGGNKDRVDFSTYKPFMDRKFSIEGMEQLQDSLISRGFTLPQRTAIMSSVLHESGGDPKAKSSTGKYRGLAQWGPDRYPGTEDMEKQINYLIESSLDKSSPNWTHGGSGVPKINSAEEGYNTFWGNIGPYNAGLYYNKGYVRPESTQARINRAVESKAMYESVKNKKGFGGELNAHGGDFTNGMIFINNGGSHETNPYEGVPMGIDPNGVPNLVEEGETIFNDYVFSRRLMVPKAIRNKYKLGGTKSISFADASKQLTKESEERPNDPISKRGLLALMADLATAQEELKARNQKDMFAYGGKLNKFVEGGRKRNKYKGVSGYNDNWVDAEGNYNEAYKAMVNARDDAGWNRHFNDQYAYYMNPANKGSLRWQAIDNFYSANPDFKIENIELTPDEVEWARAGSQNGPIGFMHTWDQSSSEAQPTSEAPLSSEAQLNMALVDSVVNSDYAWMDELAKKRPDLFGKSPATSTATKNEATKQIPRNWVKIKQDDGSYGEAMLMDEAISKGLLKGYRRTNQDDKWGDDGIDNLGYYDPAEKIDLGRNKYENLRFAPVVGLGISTITDLLGLTNKPDYSSANALLAASRNAGTYSPVSFNPIGNYLSYNPFDRDYYLTKLNAEAGATRRAISNTSGGNRAAAMAGTLAADNNYLDKIGALARQGEEYNLAQRQQVEGFNRDTNTTNSQGMLQADMANQKTLLAANELGLKGLMAGYQMRDAERLRADSNKSANISGLINSIGNIGFEAKNDNMIRRAIEVGLYGPGAQRVYMGAYGGRLKRNKRKRGLTF